MNVEVPHLMFINIKFADDKAIVALITEDEVDYRRGVDEFVDCVNLVSFS